MKQIETNWEQWESVPFVLLLHSSEFGWYEVQRWKAPPKGVIWKRYEAFDGRKMLLNFGNIIAEETDPRAQGKATHEP